MYLTRIMDERDWTLLLIGITTGLSVAGLAAILLLKEESKPQSKSKKPSTSTSSFSSSSSSSSPSPSVNTTSNVTISNQNQDTKIKLQCTQFITSNRFEKIESSFAISSAKLSEIASHFISELNKGLSKDGYEIKAIPSYVSKRPTGNERGTYFALDFGGSNFRVCQITLDGPGNVQVIQTKDTISEALKTGSGDALFGFFAEKACNFLKENGMGNGRHAKLGFTFSYPVTQTALNKGGLMHWNKGFTASGVVGVDAVDLLQKAFHKQDVEMNVVALVNDTVGTLIAHAYEDSDTYIGVILGTGSNAAYVEKIENIKKWAHDRPKSGEMIINIEWGAFDNSKTVLPITNYDMMVDLGSPNHGMQIFEKMISGKYLGELTRLVMIDLVAAGELFEGRASAELHTSYSFETSYMSAIEMDTSPELADVEGILSTLMQINPTSLNDRRIVKRICYLVGRRSSRLAAAGIAGLVIKIGKLDGCTIAIDGSLFSQYPRYANRMKGALSELLGEDAENLTLDQARDGSGIGAAIIAALAEEE